MSAGFFLKNSVSFTCRFRADICTSGKLYLAMGSLLSQVLIFLQKGVAIFFPELIAASHLFNNRRQMPLNETNFGAIFEEYQERAFFVALRFVNNREKAEDITQESFIRLRKALYRIEEENKLWPYLSSIVSNMCRDELRRIKNLKGLKSDTLLSSEIGSDEWEFEFIDDEKSPDEILLAKELNNDIRSCLVNLPSKYREIIILRYVKEMNQKQIAQIMDIPLGTMKSQLARAVAALRKELAKC